MRLQIGHNVAVTQSEAKGPRAKRSAAKLAHRRSFPCARDVVPVALRFARGLLDKLGVTDMGERGGIDDYR